MYIYIYMYYINVYVYIYIFCVCDYIAMWIYMYIHDRWLLEIPSANISCKTHINLFSCAAQSKQTIYSIHDARIFFQTLEWSQSPQRWPRDPYIDKELTGKHCTSCTSYRQFPTNNHNSHTHHNTHRKKKQIIIMNCRFQHKLPLKITCLGGHWTTGILNIRRWTTVPRELIWSIPSGNSWQFNMNMEHNKEHNKHT